MKNPGSFITYAGLKMMLEQMTPRQLAQNVVVYSGDVDDTMPVFGACLNTKKEMGKAIENEPVGAFFLLI